MRFHHVAFTVRNLDESIAWYQEKIGAKVISRYEKRGSEIAHIQVGDVRIEFFDYTQDSKPLPEYRKELFTDLHTIGTKHLCIEVENLDDTIAELTRKGVTFVTKIDTAGFGGRYIFLRDCNDILIELYQP